MAADIEKIGKLAQAAESVLELNGETSFDKLSKPDQLTVVDFLQCERNDVIKAGGMATYALVNVKYPEAKKKLILKSSGPGVEKDQSISGKVGEIVERAEKASEISESTLTSVKDIIASSDDQE